MFRAAFTNRHLAPFSRPRLPPRPALKSSILTGTRSGIAISPPNPIIMANKSIKMADSPFQRASRTKELVSRCNFDAITFPFTNKLRVSFLGCKIGHSLEEKSSILVMPPLVVRMEQGGKTENPIVANKSISLSQFTILGSETGIAFWGVSPDGGGSICIMILSPAGGIESRLKRKRVTSKHWNFVPM